MYFPFHTSGTSRVGDNGVPISPNYPRHVDDIQEESNESPMEVSSQKHHNMESDLELVQHKFPQSNEVKKSPLPYIGMIAEAISSSPDKKMVLSEIYSYMERYFFQYLSGKPRWRNTVRHNLSFHKCFVKCECSRRGNRSHFWSIHPDYIEQFNRGNFTKTLSPPRQHVNLTQHPQESSIFARNSQHFHRRIQNSEYENYLHYDALPQANPNASFPVIPSSTTAVMHPHELRPFSMMQTHPPRGNIS